MLGGAVERVLGRRAGLSLSPTGPVPQRAGTGPLGAAARPWLKVRYRLGVVNTLRLSVLCY